MALNLPTCLGKTHVAKLNCVLLTEPAPTEGPSLWQIFEVTQPQRKAVLAVPDHTLALEYCDDFDNFYAAQATRLLERLATGGGIVVVTHAELLVHMKEVKEGKQEALAIANGTTYFLDEADKMLRGRVVEECAQLIRRLKIKGGAEAIFCFSASWTTTQVRYL